MAIFQEAGLPILRSLKILEQQSKPAPEEFADQRLRGDRERLHALRGHGQAPKAFNRLYVNMIKAGEAGSALEIILKRLAEFQERAQSLKRKVEGRMIYPIFVVLFAVGILVFIMLKIVPQFQKIFKDFGTKLPAITEHADRHLEWVGNWWYLIPAIPIGFWLYIKLMRKFDPGRKGWDFFSLKVPIFGQLVEKNIIARTMRTLGTLVASGVPILEALHIRGKPPATPPSRRCSARSTTRSAKANRSPSR